MRIVQVSNLFYVFYGEECLDGFPFLQIDENPAVSGMISHGWGYPEVERQHGKEIKIAEMPTAAREFVLSYFNYRADKIPAELI